MTDFVIDQYAHPNPPHIFEDNCIKYANFIKQPLELWMFVPCDENNEIIIERNYQYQEALDKVIFDGFENSEIGYVYFNHEFHGRLMFDEEFFEDRTIEYLVRYDLPLTKTALKQIGL